MPDNLSSRAIWAFCILHSLLSISSWTSDNRISVQTDFFLFPFEKVALSPILDFFSFQQWSLETWKRLNVSHRSPNAWEQICVPHGSLHVVKSAIPRLSCRTFQTLLPWSRDRRGSCRQVVPHCCLRWETWAHNLREEIVQPSRTKDNPPCRVALDGLPVG